MIGSPFSAVYVAHTQGISGFALLIAPDKLSLRKVYQAFTLDDVNKALQKVAAGKSKGKTIIKL